MKALVFKGVGSIRLEEVKNPVIKNPTDVIVKITMSAICGTDLHMIRGTMPGMKSGTILGHEAVGVIAECGKNVKHFNVGDRVIIPSTIGCGSCDYCLKELFAQCQEANPKGADAGTAFFGGPAKSGPFDGMQAEMVRVPFGDINLIKIPNNLTDEQVILLSDILPTSFMAVEQAHVTPNDAVAVFGLGPVGQLAILCLKLRGVSKIYAIDNIPSRLLKAQQQGAHSINFDNEDPVITLKKLTHNKGPEKIIDAVGVDAEQPHRSFKSWMQSFFIPVLFKQNAFNEELKEVAPKTNPHNCNWHPGSGPSQVLQWAVEVIAKCGTLSIIGVYPSQMRFFPIGLAMNKNLMITTGNCHHRKYIPMLLDLVQEGKIDLRPFITKTINLDEIEHAYHCFDRRVDNWIKVAIKV